MITNVNLTKHVRQQRERPGPMPSPLPLLQWLGRPYGKAHCWKFVRDAFQEIGGVELPENYYEAMTLFTQVPDPRQPPVEKFVPEPWDVVCLKTLDRIPVLVLHPGVVIDSERFMQTWSDAGPGVYRFDDERVNFRIAGFIRLLPR